MMTSKNNTRTFKPLKSKLYGTNNIDSLLLDCIPARKVIMVCRRYTGYTQYQPESF